MTPLECATACHNAVSRVGGAFMVDPVVAATAQRLGLTFFQFYIAGRAGVLGAVEPDQVCAQLAILNPDAVTRAWTAAVAILDPADASAAYAECDRTWGRARLRGAAATEQVAELAGLVVDRLDVDRLPLVAGWRALPRPDDDAARCAQLLQTLREFRGAVHAHAVSAAGLRPVEAIVSGPDGPERAGLLGWPEPYPDRAAFTARRLDAERRTDELATTAFVTLSAAQRAEFVTGTQSLLDAIRTPAR